MPNDQITAYIATARAGGADDAGITQALLAAGWSAELVSEAMGQPTQVVESPPPSPDPVFEQPNAPVMQPEASVSQPEPTVATSNSESLRSSQLDKSLHTAGIFIWVHALSYAGYSIIWSVVLLLWAASMRRYGLTMSQFEAVPVLVQQPFILAALAVMLFWLGRGVWTGTKKLTHMCLGVVIGGIGVWFGMQWLIHGELVRLAGQQFGFGGAFLQSSGSLFSLVLSPIVLTAVPALISVILSLPKIHKEVEPPTLKSKIILGLLSVLVLAPAVSFTILHAVWSTDAASGFDTVLTRAGFPIHQLPSQSEFVMESHWQIAESLPKEPTPVVQAAAIIKTDLTASISARKTVTIRQYAKSSSVTPAMALNFDPKQQAQEMRQLKLDNGTPAVVSERPFGQGKIITLVFETRDGVLIKMMTIKAQLPEVLKLANEIVEPVKK